MLVVVQSLSPLYDPMDCSTPGSPSFTVSRNLLRFVSVESVMLSNHLILCCPLFLLPSIFPSIRIFSDELTLHIRWPKYWSFSISLSNEYSGLISLGLTGLFSFQSKGLSRVFSSTTVQKHQFFHVHPSLCSSSHIRTWTGATIDLTIQILFSKWCLYSLICCLGSL